MLIPILVGICIAASIVMPPAGGVLVIAARSGDSDILFSTSSLLNPELWWSIAGWLVVAIGLAAASFPYVVMLMAHHHDYIVGVFILGFVQAIDYLTCLNELVYTPRNEADKHHVAVVIR